MSILRVEHPVPDYGAWKRAFDSEPISRKASGVRRYQVMRAVDDPNYVMIDLEFDTTMAAKGFLEALRELWSRVEGTIMSNPHARIVEAVETGEY